MGQRLAFLQPRAASWSARATRPPGSGLSCAFSRTLSFRRPAFCLSLDLSGPVQGTPCPILLRDHSMAPGHICLPATDSAAVTLAPERSETAGSLGCERPGPQPGGNCGHEPCPHPRWGWSGCGFCPGRPPPSHRSADSSPARDHQSAAGPVRTSEPVSGSVECSIGVSRPSPRVETEAA